MTASCSKLHVNSTKPAGLVSFIKHSCMATLMLITVSACAENELVADSKAGEQKSAMCGQCHGKQGISIIPIYPNLAGQKKGYMETQLQAFRSGERVNAAMTPFAKQLSDQDIVDLSAYYADINPSGEK